MTLQRQFKNKCILAGMCVCVCEADLAGEGSSFLGVGDKNMKCPLLAVIACVLLSSFLQHKVYSFFHKNIVNSNNNHAVYSKCQALSSGEFLANTINEYDSDIEAEFQQAMNVMVNSFYASSTFFCSSSTPLTPS